MSIEGNKKRAKDLTGQVFGKWLAIERVGRNEHGMAIWQCECECGKKKDVLQGSLVSGTSISCGCGANKRKTTHGYLKDGNYPKEYSCWRNMINRCYNPKHGSYKDYGAKGIIVCDSWRHSFANFMKDMGEMPTKKHSIDRFPNQYGIYEPTNCRWATSEQQGENRKDSKLITFKGVTKTVRGWERFLGGHAVRWRLNNGWSEEKAVSTPIKKYKNG